MTNKNRLQMIALAACLALSFTACGHTNTNDISEDMEQMKEEQSGEGNAESLNAMLAVDEETWVDSIALGGKTISINAKVSVPDADCMKVISLDEKEMDGEYKKVLLENLCETPYVLNEMNPPQWYIDNNLEWLESLESNYYAGKYEPEDEEYCKEKIAMLKGWRERKAGEFKNQVSEAYEETEYYGEYMGHTYRYVFARPEDIDKNHMYWVPVDYNGLSHFEPASGNCYYSFGEDGLEASDNHCEMSEEEAVKVAEEFLGNLGYTGLVPDSVELLSWYDAEETPVDVEASGELPYVDGYMITFYRGIADIVIDENKSMYHCLKHGNLEREECMTEKYIIRLTDAGVIAGEIQSPYTEKEVLSERTKLLSYQQVKEVFLSLLSGDADYFKYVNTTMTLNAMELSYYPVEENGSYALVPVWRLEDQYTTYNVYTQKDEVQWVNMTIMINAIDGSVIDPGPSENQ